MQSAGVTFTTMLRNAVQRENMDITGGLLDVGSMQRNLQLKGQLKTSFDIEKIIVQFYRPAYLFKKDIATIKDSKNKR